MKTNFKTSLSMIAFQEDKVHILFSPALDLYGYGNTLEEAKQSFMISLNAFLDYAIENKTLISELKRLGWKIAEDGKVTAPPPSYFIKNSHTFKDVWNKPFRKFDKTINLPLMTA
ncbi:MAG: hypothetical protein ACK4NY_16445 [Spirosomataceae bacterium]